MWRPGKRRRRAEEVHYKGRRLATETECNLAIVRALTERLEQTNRKMVSAAHRLEGGHRG